MKKPLKINIPNPCSENWDNMLPTERGRFCNACEKVVTDFTGMTDNEIVRFFEQRKEGNTCGRYLESQIGRHIAYETPSSKKLQSGIAKKIAASILLLNGISTHVFAQKAKTNQQTLTVNKKPYVKTVIVTGKVLDDQTTAGVPNIFIRIAKTDLHTITDINGNFNFSIPEDIVNAFKTLDFIPNFISNEDSGSLMGLSIETKDLDKPIVIYKFPHVYKYTSGGQKCITGGDEIIRPQKKHWYNLFKRKITNEKTIANKHP